MDTGHRTRSSAQGKRFVAGQIRRTAESSSRSPSVSPFFIDTYLYASDIREDLHQMDLREVGADAAGLSAIHAETAIAHHPRHHFTRPCRTGQRHVARLFLAHVDFNDPAMVDQEVAVVDFERFGRPPIALRSQIKLLRAWVPFRAIRRRLFVPSRRS